MSSPNVTHHAHLVDRASREQLMGHRGCVCWLTGLSASGKSSIANALDRRLHRRGVHSMVLDGDNLRMGLNGDLGFSVEDRAENVRRTGAVAILMASAGLIAISALTSPAAAERARVRASCEAANVAFVEVHVDASLETCETRDPKGLYAKARNGELPGFTGIDPSARYEAPEAPELRMDSDLRGVEELASEIEAYLYGDGGGLCVLPAAPAEENR